MYSDNDGETWQKYNKESLNKYATSPYVEDLSYDSENDKLILTEIPDTLRSEILSELGEEDEQ